MSEQIDQLNRELFLAKESIRVERFRTDHLMALNEGLYEKREAYQLARTSPEFQAVYEEREPLVSICVSTCNRSSLLVERCIKSLLRQTYRNLQIVVVGDHCTDDTAYRLAKLRDSRIVFENLPQRGPYPAPGINRWCVAGTMATNRAIDLAEGAFLAHLDDDDESDMERVEVMVAEARRTRADFLWHKFLAETPQGLWLTLGSANLDLGHVTTGAIFYHRYFGDIQWDPFAYRLQEPGDWNRIRKIKFLKPQLQFVDRILMIHYREGQQSAFVPRPGETFVD